MRKNILIMALMAIFALSTPMEAQKVTREGNTLPKYLTSLLVQMRELQLNTNM